MDWLTRFGVMQEYYHWKKNHHPAYPDMRLEWGLFHHLYGYLLLEEACSEGDRNSAHQLLAEADRTLAEMKEDGYRFDDFLEWSNWATEQESAEGTPDPSVIEAHFRESLGLSQALFLDELLGPIGDIGNAPMTFHRVATCKAFRRVFSSMGEFLLHRDELDGAGVAHAWAVLISCDPSRYWIYRAQGLRASGQMEKLDVTLKDGLGQFPDNIELLRESARELERHGDIGGAIKLLERAVNLRPEWPDLRYNLARLFQEDQNLDESLTQFDKALEINPGYARAAISRAETLMQMGDMAQAESKLLGLQENDVKSREIYQLLSRIYAERHDLKEADHFGVMALGQNRKAE
jgi:tetratricopeptide (TPR) repeat protein